LKILLAGMLAKAPGQGGASWATLQYLEGLLALGHEVLLVEELPQGRLDDPTVTRYFRSLSLPLLPSGRTVTLLEAGSKRTLGLPLAKLQAFARQADLLLNLSGTLRNERLLQPIEMRVFLDLDPCFNQIWHEQGHDLGLQAHTHFATVGTLLGRPQCAVPTCGREWIVTLPPVSLEHWQYQTDPPRRDAFTTVGHWRSYGSVERDGVLYGQRAHSLRRLLDLPSLAPASFQLALGIHPHERSDLDALAAHGWQLLDPQLTAGTPQRYREFVNSSKAELCIAKSGYVDSCSGWFSDRSACYLAAGRPVIAQDTGFGDAIEGGFGDAIKAGEGLLSFHTAEQAAEAVAEVVAHPERHRKAARALAEEHFDARKVLSRLLGRLDASRPRQTTAAG
jgi:hypothetical protein